MSVEKVGTILKMADEANTTAIAFNCTDYNTIVSVVKVAEELSKPVICMLYPEHAYLKHWTTPKIFVETVRDVAKNVKVPVGIHLDHCSDFDYIVAAMRCGFDSVMYDGSMLPVEENIKNTAEIVKVAKAFGADVEAELGRVGFASTVADQNDTDKYTKPEVAAAFCEQSGCSSVAVAIGSAHGFYKETPKLDIERLKKIVSLWEALSGEIMQRGITRELLLTEQFSQWAVTTPIYNIGEQVYQLSPEFKKEYPGIPWSVVSGLRHRLVHDYDGINWSLIADVIFDDMEPFVMQVRDILRTRFDLRDE